MANFILSYDVSSALKMQQQLSAYVKSNRHIDQWSQPFLGVYLIKSNHPLTVLGEDFRDFFGGTFFVIAPAYQADGWLPAQFWTWFNMPDANALSSLGIGAMIEGGLKNL